MGSKKRRVQQVLLHLVLWLTFYSIWLFPFITQSRPMPPNLPVRMVLLVFLFYFNYFFLVPKLLLKKKTLIYLSVSTAIVLGLVALMLYNFPEQEISRQNGPRPPLSPFAKYTIGLYVPFVISTLLKIYTEWRKNDDLRQIVEKEKINSELQFLKTQLNPHFLFNSLNAIYSLSVKKSPDTSDAIINLSELMRYMLYEADKGFVPLKKELEYIQNFVKLQRLRLSDSENVTLKISGEYREKIIPPLLFISFIENAFKYGTDFEGKTNVKISLFIKDDSLHLYVMNKIGAFKKKSKNSGVGLINIKNRLDLLYPDSHELIVSDDGKTYEVNLTLKL